MPDTASPDDPRIDLWSSPPINGPALIAVTALLVSVTIWSLLVQNWFTAGQLAGILAFGGSLTYARVLNLKGRSGAERWRGVAYGVVGLLLVVNLAVLARAFFGG
jgi:hypothetical protein